MSGNQITVIISHRLSAVKNADQIVVMKEGMITESGNHDELMKADNYYARTFRMQEIEEEMNAI